VVVLDQGIAVAKWHLSDQLQLISTRCVPVGGEVFRENPLVWVHAGAERHSAWDLTDHLLSDRAARAEYLSWNLKRMPLPNWDLNDKGILNQLSDRHRTPKPVIKSIYISVVTNSIACFVRGTPPIQGYGLFKVLSRANHDCSPNSELVPGDTESGGNSVLALEEIQPGTPITFNYLWGNVKALSHRTRNMLLVDRYGFVCDCRQCQADCPPDLVNIDQLAYFKNLIRQHRLASMDIQMR
jgi:hypothetical protein